MTHNASKKRLSGCTYIWRYVCSAQVWSLYADMEESFGTFKSAKAVYDRILDLKIATPQVRLQLTPRFPCKTRVQIYLLFLLTLILIWIPWWRIRSIFRPDLDPVNQNFKKPDSDPAFTHLESIQACTFFFISIRFLQTFYYCFVFT